MKPLIEDIKTDKLINENFESIRAVLCGNVSLDNMSLRLLEGTTKESDTKNLVVHSGNSRPVGWLPLVGDVYVQEINEKHIDIRSTKPETNYKILALFGNNITTTALKAEGGPAYQNTEEVATTQAIEQIQLKEETEVQYKPLVTNPYSHPNPCLPNNAPSSQYNRVVADANYFYMTMANATAPTTKYLWRINRTTNVVDYLDLTASCPTSGLGVLVIYGTDLYVAQGGNTTEGVGSIMKVDTTTFTLTTTWACARNAQIQDIHVNMFHCYYTYGTSTKHTAYIGRIDLATNAVTELALTAIDLAHTFSPYAMMVTQPVGIVTGAIWVVVDNNFKASAELVRVEIYDPVLQTHLFAVTDTILGTVAYSAITGVSVGQTIYIPVVYDITHRITGGGTVGYPTGLVVVHTVDNGPLPPTYDVSFVPINIPASYIFLDTILESAGFIYMVGYNAGTGVGNGSVVFQYDPASQTTVYAYASIATTGKGIVNCNSLAFKDSDGEILYLRNTGNTDYGNFEYGTVDFSDYA